MRAQAPPDLADATLRDYLLRTGERILVEASPLDRIWGIGMSRDTPGVDDPTQWRGLNLLGYALMRVRADLAATTHDNPQAGHRG